MNNFPFLTDLAIVMVAAGVSAVVCQLLKQPRIVGFIIAGLIIGPHAYFKLIATDESIRTLGDIGLIFLMFSLGLEFNLRKLLSSGATTFITAFVDVIFMFWLGFVLGRLMGWDTMSSAFLGAIICDSSTTVITRILQELGQVRERFASIVIGATIVEDLIAIVLITLLTGAAIQGKAQPGEVMFRIAELVTFIVVVMLSGVFVFRRIVDYVAGFKNDELLLITVLGLCFSVSLVAATMNFSLALGAFMVGAILADSKAAGRINAFIEPVRNTFGPLFFVAMGMLIEPAIIRDYMIPIILLIIAVMAGKVIAGSLGAFLSGNNRDTSLRVGCGLAQICEFAIIFAALGRQLNVTDSHVYSMSVAVAVGTIFLNPHLVRHAGTLNRALEKITPNALGGTMAVYTKWYRRSFSGAPVNPAISKLVRRSFVTMGINMCLITAIFITATMLERYVDPRLHVPDWIGGTSSLYWLAGALLCIPLYVANIRKINALSMLAAELRFPIDSTHPHAAIARALAEKIIFFAGVTALGIYTFMLSSALLPPLHSLVILLCVVAIVTAVFWKFQIRLYSKVQNMLRDAFAAPANEAGTHHERHKPLRAISGPARVMEVDISEDSAAAEKTVAQLDVGASIVGIERDGATIVPKDDEVVKPGDVVLIVSDDANADKAASLLSDEKPS